MLSSRRQPAILSDPERSEFSSNSLTSGWTQGILTLVALLLLFEAVNYGAVEAWSELVAIALAGILAILVLTKLAFDRQAHLPLSWLWLPLTLFMGLATWQATSLPASVLETVASATFERKLDFLGSEALGYSSISYYPVETWRSIRMMLVGIVLFATGLSLGQERTGAKWLLVIVFGAGCSEALFSLLQIVAQEDWLFSASGRDARTRVTSGTFLNYSNFSQFVNLGIGAGLALLVTRLEHYRRPSKHGLSWQTFWKREGWILLGLAICALAIFASLSRNGVLAMMVAGGGFLLLISRRNSTGWATWSLVAVPIVVFGGLVVVGFDLVYDRLATTTESVGLADRWELTLATLRAWQDHSLWGVGLGAHEFAFPPYDTTGALSIAQTADNDYAQLLEETGLIGAALVACFLSLLLTAAYQLIHRGKSSLSLACYGLLYAFLAVGVQSLTDFGQRLPAIFSLSAILSGLLIGIARREQASAKTQAKRESAKDNLPTTAIANTTNRHRWFAAFAALLLIPTWTMALTTAFAAYQGEQAWGEAFSLEQSLSGKDWIATDQEYAALLVSAETAALYQPRNVTYVYWLNVYRWQSLLRASSQGSEYWKGAEFLSHARTIADELSTARKLCPTYGPAYSLEGRIRYFTLGELVDGERLILLGCKLAPHDPEALFVMGLLSIQQQRPQEAMQAFGRLLELNASYFPQVAEQLVLRLAAPDQAEILCGDNIGRLETLARMYEANESLVSRATKLRQRRQAILDERVEEGDATPSEVASLAKAAQAAGNLPKAIRLLREALGHDYTNLAWRLKLAVCLRDAGQLDAATHELKICLRLRPGNNAASQLLEEVYDLKRAGKATP